MRINDLYNNTKGHVWQLDNNGSVDLFAFQYLEDEDLEPIEHNGPICVNCGFGFCYHCHDSVPQACTIITNKES